MKRFILYNLIVFTLLSCGNPNGQFRLTGEFEHLQQGEFYLYSPEEESVTFDTISLIDGKFEYKTTLKEKTILYLLYPNFTEQAIIAQNGAHVKIKGDAQKLTQTEVSGTKDNDLLTKFRLNNNNRNLNETRKDAMNLILENPSSLISKYLFEQYFLYAKNIDTTQIIRAYQAICNEQTESPQMIKWQTKINALIHTINANSFGHLTFITSTNDSVTLTDYKDKPILLTIWASWLSNSFYNYQTKKIWARYQDSIQVLSISLDLSEQDLKEGLKRSDIQWPVYCSFDGWNDPITDLIGLQEIPYYYLFDKDQKLVIASNKISEDITPALNKLIHTE